MYLDDCAYAKGLVRVLEAAGHEVVTPAQAGLTGRDDPVHFRHAANNSLVLLTKNPDIFWGVVASMYLGNAMLLVLNLPLIGLWVQLLRIPYPYLMPAIVLFCTVGSYSVANSITDVYLMLGFGIIGYLMKKLKFDSPPLVLAFVLGPLIEYYFKSSLMFSRGSFTVFFTRPISLACLSISAAILLWSIVAGLRRRPLPIPKEAP
jgi:putative tricarboxylic transport membrane protein